ncbi:MAG: SRPBCC family protein [Acidimicrobiales bacterium]
MAIDLPAPPQRVWAELRDLSSHTAWMDDAVAITFTSRQREGVGTTFDCLTKIGPIRTRDRLRVTQWVDGKLIGIAHEGLIAGSGTFELRRKRRNVTRLVWKERLRPPWWLGGRVSGVVGGALLHRVAKRDLRNLRALF